ncbi:ribonuclease H-like domain-containing protein [Aspergillus fruticulosus]
MSKGERNQATKKASADGSFCSTCQKPFVDSRALHQHVQSSKAHATGTSTTVLRGKTTKTETTTNTAATDDTARRVVSTKLTGLRRTLHSTTSSRVRSEQRKPSTKRPATPKLTSSASVDGQVPSEERDLESEPLVWGNWSYIPVAEQESIFDALRAKCHSAQTLSGERYLTQRPTTAEIEASRKCVNCGMTQRKASKFVSSTCRFHPDREAYQKQRCVRGRGTGSREKCIRCDAKGSKNSCTQVSEHIFGTADPKVADTKPCPSSPENANQNALRAVVLDCEMVGVEGPNKHEVSDVVRLSAVNFLTGEILVDDYVQPKQKVISWRTQYSGVSRSLLNQMANDGRKVHQGWQSARQLIWNHMDDQTILIGHNLKCDLDVLGIAHSRIVDSMIMARRAVSPTRGGSWGLRTLVGEFCGRVIQAGSSGHDCLEDTFATREVVLWCLRNQAELNRWANAESGGFDEGNGGTATAAVDVEGWH